ncbi:hypothetical protein MTO96_027543 [Rhipicephalus appendiculatus]
MLSKKRLVECINIILGHRCPPEELAGWSGDSDLETIEACPYRCLHTGRCRSRCRLQSDGEGGTSSAGLNGCPTSVLPGTADWLQAPSLHS